MNSFGRLCGARIDSLGRGFCDLLQKRQYMYCKEEASEVLDVVQ